jgi:lysyl-tRNA synthetase class 1
VVPRDRWSTEAIVKLKHSGHLPDEPTEYGVKRVLETIPRAYNWVEKFGGPELKFTLNSLEEASKVAEKIPADVKELLKRIYENLQSLVEWREELIKDALVAVTSKLSMEEVKRLYEYFYLLLVGKSSGPRAAPLLALLGRERALEYLAQVVRS